MTTRDVLNDFAFQPVTTTTPAVPMFSLAGLGAGTYLLPNTWDTGTLSAYLTQLNFNDKLLTVGAQTLFVDEGADQTLKWVLN